MTFEELNKVKKPDLKIVKMHTLEILPSGYGRVAFFSIPQGNGYESSKFGLFSNPTGNCQTTSIMYFVSLFAATEDNKKIIEAIKEAYDVLWGAQNYSHWSGAKMKMLTFDVRVEYLPRLKEMFGKRLMFATEYTSTRETKMVAGAINFVGL